MLNDSEKKTCTGEGGGGKRRKTTTAAVVGGGEKTFSFWVFENRNEKIEENDREN